MTTPNQAVRSGDGGNIIWPLVTTAVMCLGTLIILTIESPERFVAPFATITVGLLALSMASTQLKTNREIARTKNTLDFIFKFDTDKYYVELRSAWASKFEMNSNEGEAYERLLGSLGTVNAISKSEGYMQVCDFMTMLDVVAVSVEEGLFDEMILLRVYSLQFLIYWNGMQPYLQAYRRCRDVRSHAAFERLVAKCQKMHPDHVGV